MALKELVSEWGRELNLQGSVLKGSWRGKGNLDELLIYEVGSRVKTIWRFAWECLPSVKMNYSRGLRKSQMPIMY